MSWVVRATKRATSGGGFTRAGSVARFMRCAASLMVGGLIVTGLAGGATVSAQQVIQLPTYDIFAVSTTVVVPDGGSIILGGVNRSAYGSTTRGVPGLSKVPGANRLFTNRAIGRETSSSTASVTVHIHDFQAMDEALLAEARERAGDGARNGDGRSPGGNSGGRSVDAESRAAIERKAEFLNRHMSRREK